MQPRLFIWTTALACAAYALAQNRPAPLPEPATGNAPIYRINVVERTVKAVNYRYRSGPTLIDLRGTVLLPDGKGIAKVESSAGRTDIDASVNHMKPPQQYGREYMTYVLWAITPEGRPHNLGEVALNHSDDGRIHVTTDLQAFAMIVTAEPYWAVRQPSDVVVLENQIRPDTEGTFQTVNAKYELLPRGEYTWQPGAVDEAVANAPKVSTRQYEALAELYQAENAVGVAGAAGAQQYAPDTYASAQQLLSRAQSMQAAHADSHRMIEIARQAAQTAEDARLIAVQRQQQDQLRSAQASLDQARQQAASALASAQQLKGQADQEVQQAQIAVKQANERANALEAQIQADQAALSQAQNQAVSAGKRAREEQAESRIERSSAQAAGTAATRSRLLNQLNTALPALDTPRGLIVTVADSGFSGETVRAAEAERIARAGAILAAQPGLRVKVEGYSETAAQQPLSETRAFAVRRVLTNNGLAPSAVIAEGFGDSRPLGPPGQAQNSRVEIVITGSSVIGALPNWDHPYSLASQ